MMDEVFIEDLLGGKATSVESEGEFFDISLEEDNWKVSKEELEKI